MSATAVLTVATHVSEWTVMSEQVEGGELRAGNLWHREVKWETNGFKLQKTRGRDNDKTIN